MSIPALNPVGLTVRHRQKPCPECKSIDSVIAGGDDEHYGEMVCVRCDKHRGWISQRTHDFIVGIIHRFGRPTEPILLRVAKRESAPPKESSTVSANNAG
jgi:hypothetical protein